MVLMGKQTTGRPIEIERSLIPHPLFDATFCAAKEAAGEAWHNNLETDYLDIRSRLANFQRPKCRKSNPNSDSGTWRIPACPEAAFSNAAGHLMAVSIAAETWMQTAGSARERILLAAQQRSIFVGAVCRWGFLYVGPRLKSHKFSPLEMSFRAR